MYLRAGEDGKSLLNVQWKATVFAQPMSTIMDRRTERLRSRVDKEEGNVLLKKDDMKREKGSERQWTGE